MAQLLTGAGELVAGVLSDLAQSRDLLRNLLRCRAGRTEQVLADLEAGGRAQTVERLGTRFWCSATGRYPV